MATTIGEKIYKLRKAKGFTLDELAKRTDSSKSYIWELENRNPPRPSADKLFKIAHELGVTADYLLDQEGKITEASAEDEMFFRKYKEMPQETKEKLKKIMDLWDD